jgi:hypothetical protein
MTRFNAATVLCLALTVASSSNAFVVQPPPAARSQSNVVLHMNLFDRFTRVAKSNLNNILKNLEDPEKIMTQALEDMQVSVVDQLKSAFREPFTSFSDRNLSLIYASIAFVE